MYSKPLNTPYICSICILHQYIPSHWTLPIFSACVLHYCIASHWTFPIFQHMYFTFMYSKPLFTPYISAHVFYINVWQATVHFLYLCKQVVWTLVLPEHLLPFTPGTTSTPIRLISNFWYLFWNLETVLPEHLLHINWRTTSTPTLMFEIRKIINIFCCIFNNFFVLISANWLVHHLIHLYWKPLSIF